MYFMNEYEIDEMVRRHRNTPVLNRATKLLAAFKDDVNGHSDGWSYWRPPVRAAKQLMTLIQAGKATDQDFAKSLRPIKSFYTRRGNAAGMSFPVILPEYNDDGTPRIGT